MIEFLMAAYVCGVGAIIGSFLNVLIFRLPRHENFVTERSHCPHCHEIIRWYDNIPLLSFIILRGRCRYCRGRISWTYPAVELFTALFFLGSFLLYGLSYQTLIINFLFAMLLAITVIDFGHYLIPNQITYPGIILGLLFSLFPQGITPLDSLLGFLCGGVSFYLLALLGDFLFKKESLGGGDIKLAALLGAFLGWEKIILTFFAAAVLGLIYAAILMARSSEMRQKRLIPFGPFLSAAGLLTFFVGDRLIRLYIDRFLIH